MHSQGFIHNAVTFSNIFVVDQRSYTASQNYRVRLGGFSRVTRILGGEAPRAAFGTKNNKVFQSPEVLAGALPTPAADVYSLGVILYTLACGAIPKHESNFDQAGALIWAERALSP